MRAKAVLVLEVVSAAYMLALLWYLFPEIHQPTRFFLASCRYQWQLGRLQMRLAGLPAWAQEAAVVRGKLPQVETPFPRPLNLPD